MTPINTLPTGWGIYYRSDDHITSVNPARKDVVGAVVGHGCQGTTDVERPKVPWRIKRKGRDALDAAKDERGWEKKWVHKQLVVVHFGGGRRKCAVVM
ncbi:hypothetical protein BC936DRAFT_144892 [Jimgerdemannia flammicorona]|uniref:Uncharacterized protein n=1 Tax=Jimgerdemannia flammicorona TaxID=994334 RepID=A0A433DBF3_9FUNG|nr:hypothetical protein BC936DRAFT_144892 [Jimgerdemannia flammicorona]